MKNQFVDPFGIGRARKIVAKWLIFSLVLAAAPVIPAVAEEPGIAWKTVGGSLKQVSADDRYVWGVDSGDAIYRMPVDGSGNWERVTGGLSSISASGRGFVWGVNRANKIYRCAKPCPANGSGWRLIPGDARQVSADETSVWVTQPSGAIWRRPVDGSGAWQQVTGGLSVVSASGKGWIWGVNSASKIYKCAKPCAANGSGWQLVPGDANDIWADHSSVWVIRSGNSIWRMPVDGSGTWQQVPGGLKNIASSPTGWVWGVDTNDAIFMARTDAPAAGVPATAKPPQAAATPAAVQAAKPSPSANRSLGLVGLWRFEGNTTDASTHNNNGTLKNGASLSSDTPSGKGQSLQIGGGQQHLLVPHSDSLNLKTGLTIAAWVKTVGKVGWDGILAKNPSAGSAKSHAGNYELRIENGSRKLTLLYQQGGANDSTFHSSTPAIADGVWTHIAVTARANGPVRYYVNGTLAGTDSQAIRPGFGATNTSPLYIGSRADLFTGLDGFLDDVAIFDRPLRPAEITAVAAGGFNRFGASGGETLVALTPTAPEPPAKQAPQIVQGTVVVTPQPASPKPKPEVIMADVVIIGEVVDPNPKPVEPAPQQAAPAKPQMGGTLVLPSSAVTEYSGDLRTDIPNFGSTFDPNGQRYFVDEEAFCWKRNFSRVSLPTLCEDGVLDVGMCYPKCAEGEHRHLTRCYEDCPEGFIDDIALCRRPPDTIAKLSYGNTGGIPMVCPPGKEEGAGLCYDQCPDGYYGIAGICWKNSCPAGYKNDPLTCRRDPVTQPRPSHPRGSTSMTCTEGFDQIGALCYPKCKAGFNGELDWCRKPCPAGYHDDGVTCSVAPHATTADNSPCPWYDKCCIALGKDQGFRSKCPDGYRNDGCTCFRDAKIVPQESYYRGQVPFNGCPDGMEQNGALCYPTCKDNYSGDGPACWGGCPDGFDTHPVTCHKSAHIYSKDSRPRGAGTVPSACPAGYEKDPGGALCYPKCKAGYDMIGPACWRKDRDAAMVEECPEGYRDDGLLCTRDLYSFGPRSYDTGVGSFPACPEGESNVGGVCYKDCGQGYHAVGPICWQQCPGTIPIDSGATCSGSDGATARGVGKMIFAAWDILMNAVSVGGWAAAKSAGKAGVKGGVKATLKGLGQKVADKFKKAPQKIVSNLDEAGEQLGKSADEVAAGITKVGDDVVEVAVDSSDDVAKAAGSKLDDVGGQAADMTLDQAGDRLRQNLDDLRVEQAASGDLDAKLKKTQQEKLIKSFNEGMATYAKVKGIGIDAGINAGALIEETVNAGELTLEILSYADLTGIYDLIEAFNLPQCEVLPPGAFVQEYLKPVTGYSGSIFGGRGSSDDADFALSTPVETVSQRGEGGPAGSTAEFILPSDLTIECNSPDGTVVWLGNAVALSNSVNVTFSNTAPDLFPLGVTTITWTSKSETGDASQGKQQVLVTDTTPPMILADAAEYVLECSSPEGAPFVQTASAADVCDGQAQIDSDAPDLLPLGTTVVNWSATDKAGNEATASQSIRVVDTTPPFLSCQQQVFAYAETDQGADVPFEITATDNCGVVETVTCSSAPGSRFPVGATPVSCQAADGAGLTATCSFQVNVIPPQPKTREEAE